MSGPGRRTGRVAVALSLALYIAALVLPALEFADQDPVLGYTALLWGWWGVLSFDFPWFANVAYIAALFFLLFGKRRVSLMLSASAIVLGLLSLGVDEWWFNEGSATPVESLGSAFYVWMSSFGVLFLAAVLSRRGEGPAEGPIDAPAAA